MVLIGLTNDEYRRYKYRNINWILEKWILNKMIMGGGIIKLILKKQYSKNIAKKILFKKFVFDFILSRRPSFANLDFQITTKCTLQCEQCCSLMTFYKDSTQVMEDFDSFKIKLDALLKAVDKIYRLQLIGGEPLLNKDLAKMVEYASKQKQIKYIVTITNGTILPNENLLKIYEKYKYKNFIDVSDYTSSVKKVRPDNIVRIFNMHNVVAYKSSFEWFSRGDIKKSNRNEKQLEKEFSSCWQIWCPSYCDGELHICSRSVGIRRNITNSVDDYVLVIDNKNASKEIVKLFLKKYILACDYCHTDMKVKIPRGVQIKNND